jgi:hypothetical protein
MNRQIGYTYVAMTTIPNNSQSHSRLFAIICAVIPLYALRMLVINPFLAVTTIFPFVILMSGTSVQAEYFKKSYVGTLDFFTQTLFGKSLTESTDADLIAIFFILLLILSLAFTGIEKLFNRYGFRLHINWKHVAAIMTSIYAISAFVSHGDADNPEPIFWLMLYLFNIYSIVGYHFIGVAMKQLRAASPFKIF